MCDFKIKGLDHVAIRVKDLQESIDWYRDVLGLSETRFKEWGDYPVFMLAGDSGIALFPATLEDEPINSESKNIKIDHFAFNVSKEDLQKAEKKYKSLGLEYYFEDHIYFHSLYTKDPNGHKVELTTTVN